MFLERRTISNTVHPRTRSAISPFVISTFRILSRHCLPQSYRGNGNTLDTRWNSFYLISLSLSLYPSLSIHLFVLHYLYYKSAVMFNSLALRLPCETTPDVSLKSAFGDKESGIYERVVPSRATDILYEKILRVRYYTPGARDISRRM